MVRIMGRALSGELRQNINIIITLVQNRFSVRVEERLSEVVWRETYQIFRRSLK